jgi:hypothetical protein
MMAATRLVQAGQDLGWPLPWLAAGGRAWNWGGQVAGVAGAQAGCGGQLGGAVGAKFSVDALGLSTLGQHPSARPLHIGAAWRLIGTEP